MAKRVVVTGSLAFDHIMSMPGKFGDHIMKDKIHSLNVSFIMDAFRRERGGTGGNIAYSLALLSVPTLLVGSGGHDFEVYMEHLKTQKHIDLSGLRLYQDIPTAQGFVMTDREDNQIWGFFEGAMKRESELEIDGFLQEDDLLVVAPNNPVAMMKYVRSVTVIRMEIR